MARSKKSQAIVDGALSMTVPDESVGLGVDIVEIGRMEKILARSPSFAEKVYSAAERAYCDTQDSRLLAWTMKEALYKASRRHFSFEPAFDTDLHLSGRAAGLDFNHAYISVKDSIVAIVWR